MPVSSRNTLTDTSRNNTLQAIGVSLNLLKLKLTITVSFIVLIVLSFSLQTKDVVNLHTTITVLEYCEFDCLLTFTSEFYTFQCFRVTN